MKKIGCCLLLLCMLLPMLACNTSEGATTTKAQEEKPVEPEEPEKPEEPEERAAKAACSYRHMSRQAMS